LNPILTKSYDQESFEGLLPL
jgi:hypothetical protein